jgi:hypothetical protein
MSTELDEVLDFLTTTVNQGYLNDNTAIGRKTACSKLFEILEDDQKTVAYVRENIEAIKTRFQNLNKNVRGQTIEEYGRRVLFAVNDYMKWMADRSGWEREAGSRGNNRAEAGSKVKQARAEKAKPATAETVSDSSLRMVTYPLRPDTDITMTIPRRDFTIAEARKIYLFLATIASDFDPTVSPQAFLKLLEQDRAGDMN